MLTLPSLLRTTATAFVAAVSASVLLATATAAPQQAEIVVTPWAHESSDLPVDPAIRFGQLENGLRYAIAENPEPRDRCYLRLHVDVGSLYEEESERGMAHFLEHMAFNGTEHFPPAELITWFQEHGMAFGADTNAMTSFDETIYEIDLPQTDTESIQSGLTVLRDFASGMLLRDDEVNAEKGVIDGEERERDSTQMRVGLNVLGNLLEGTRIPNRIPIGTKEARDAFTGDSVRAFYTRWYRPDRMTVAIVGDLGGQDVEPLVRAAFESMTNPVGPRAPDPELGMTPAGDRFFSIYEPEMPVAQVVLQRTWPHEAKQPTRATVAEGIPLALANAMLSKRLQALTRKGEAPFLAARAAKFEEGFSILDGATLMSVCGPDKWRESLAVIEKELRQAMEFGFGEDEFGPTLADWKLGLRESAERAETRDSRALLGGILQAAAKPHVPMNPVTRSALLLEIANSITVEDCHVALKKAWGRGDLLAYTAGALDLGDDPGRLLRAALDEIRQVPLEQREAETTAAFAYPSTDDPAWSRGRHIEDLDLWCFEFDNGVRLNVKQTDFKERQVTIVVDFGDGELSMEPMNPALSSVASDVFIAGGLEAHDSEELNRILAGRQAGVGFSIASDHFELSGSTTPDDLLLELELLCAYMTNPGFRTERLERMRRELPIVFESLKHSIQTPIMKEFSPAFMGSPRLASFPTAEELTAVTMEDVKQWLLPILKNAPIEATIVGDIDVASALQLASRTLGRLPRRTQTFAPVGRRNVEAPKAGLRMTQSVETQVPKALVRVSFPTTDGIDAGSRRLQHLLSLVVSDRLRAEIRERLGAAYSPSASSSASSIFPGVGHLDANVLADPDRVDDVVKATLAVAENLRANGVTAEEIERIREPELKRIRDLRRSNGVWVQWIRDAQSNPSALSDARGILDFYRDASAEDLSAIAARYLDPQRASVMVVTPAATKKVTDEAEPGPR